jgi:hypothetical protein
MKYEVIKGCVIQGKPCKVGDVVDLDQAQVNILIGIGRIAVFEKKEAVAKVVEEPVVLENRSVGLETSDEAPVVRKNKKK